MKFKSLLASVLSAVFICTSATAAVASPDTQSLPSPKTLTYKLVNSQNQVELWDSFSESQKESVKSFVAHAEQKATSIQNSGLTDSQKEEEVKRLSEDEKLAVQAYFTPVSIRSEVKDSKTALSPAANSNWVEVNNYATNVFGAVLYRWYHRVDWEYNGSNVSNVRYNYWPQTQWILWSYAGLYDQGGDYDRQNTTHTSYSQAHFKMGVGWINVQHAYPRISVTVNNNGGYSYRTS
ncbi:hypothetical protein [Paenibacillus elgii]|uniref:hypothetical protein n=1 Tax=Paenibacillus elgii TaxID=189691 RepID=UPI0011129B43|nr:hypothetical protein [Paenibacillus elgii]